MCYMRKIDKSWLHERTHLYSYQRAAFPMWTMWSNFLSSRPAQSKIIESYYDHFFKIQYFILQKHVKFAHPDESDIQSFACTVCNKVFKKASYLQRHITLHSGQKPYNCPYCDKSFRLPNVLVKHKRTHTGERPYECEVNLKNLCFLSFFFNFFFSFLSDLP